MSVVLNDTDLNSKGLRADERRERFQLFGLSLPALLLVIIVLIIPIAWLFYVSFIGADGNFSLENYERMIKRKSYARIFQRTFEVSLITTGLCILIGYPLAYFMSQLPTKIANICLITVLLPFWTSLLVRTYAWLVLLQKNGLINNWAINMGLWDEPIKMVHNMTGTIIGMVHIMLPFLILPVYGAMKSIDKGYLKAASNLGASPSKAFWTVFFPLSAPGLVAGSLIVFVLCLGFYVTPAVLGGGKRVRPLLTYACGEVLNIEPALLDAPAAAVLNAPLVIRCASIISVGMNLSILAGWSPGTEL